VIYPEADIPVIQLSIDTAEPAAWHYALAKNLDALRDDGVLILGSGNIVHNLGVMEHRNGAGFAWAKRIAALMKKRIAAGDHDALIDYLALDPDIEMAVPTPEHYLPLLYVLALRRAGESAAFFNERCVMGSISMTCVRIS
jgi:4,5-DOPA dioxygenase extradiol